MNRLLFYIVLNCLVGISLQRSTPESDSYVAGVVEFEVSRGDSRVNLNNYVSLIEQAAQQNVDIVVFPEMTLMNGTQSARVPIHGLLREFPVPALHPELYDEFLVVLSAAARQYQIYVVVNIREEMNCQDAPGEYCPVQRIYRFNTNVVFDRNGTLIDRYRKINLFGEASHTPALQPDLGIFETDFGVTFGHFICFDLMFQVPAVQVAQRPNITDIVFTTMWFSELPFLTAVQIQEAYAYSLNVNFLASGANNVRVGSTGSGIFSGKAGALISLMSGVPRTQLLISRVPKVPGQVTTNVSGPIYDDPASHDDLRLIIDPSLLSYTTRQLVPGFQEFTLVDKDVSCQFTIRLNYRNGETNYNYRAGAFKGVRSFSGVETGGSRVCSVFACTGNTIDTCGDRFTTYKENTTAIFEQLSIVATVPTPTIDPLLDADNSTMFPISMQVSIMPLEPKEFAYSFVRQNDITVHTLTLNNNAAELYTFALWGREFATDREDPTPPREDIDSTTENPATNPEPSPTPDSSFVHVLSNLLMIPLLALMLR